jgi:hypothetical protein
MLQAPTGLFRPMNCVEANSAADLPAVQRVNNRAGALLNLELPEEDHSALANK